MKFIKKQGWGKQTGKNTERNWQIFEKHQMMK
jgi:hypothetical protein